MLALGSGTFGTFLFFLGWQRRLTLPWILGLAIALSLPGLRLLPTRRGRWFVFGWIAALRPRFTWPTVVLTLVALPFPMGYLLDLAMPVLEYDSTMYHMAAAGWYSDTHRIVYHGGIRFNALPHLPVMLYLRHMVLLGDDAVAKFFNLEILLTMALAVGHVARRYRVSPWWGMLFLATSPVLSWVARVEYADWALAGWFAVAAVWIAECGRSVPIRAALLPGLTLGFAGACKMQGIVMAAGLGLAYLISFRRWKPVVGFAIGVVLCGAPWWVRSWHHTGSPAFPFFVSGNVDAKALFEIGSQYGMGRDGMALFLLPWRLMAASPNFFADPYIFGPALLLLIGTLLVIAAHAVRRKRRPTGEPQIVFWATTLLVYFGFWFLTGQVTRYLAAALPVMALLFLAVIARLSLSPKWLLAIATVAAIFQLSPSMIVRFHALPPVTLADKESLLARELSYYPAVRDLNRVAKPTDRVYTLFCEEVRYYVRAISYGDWFGDYSYLWAGELGSTPEQLVARLRSAGFRYLLTDRESAAKDGLLYSQEFLQSGFAQPGGPVPRGVARLYDDDRYALWRLD